MAEIHAFRGWRYNLAKVGELSSVVAPPYDVIDSRLQDQLYERSLANVIRLELNKEMASDSAQDNRYTRAAKLLHDWKADGSLVEDSSPQIYTYHQTFDS